MSGSKTFSVSTGMATVAAPVALGAGGMLLGAAALYGLAKGTEAVVRLSAKQIKARQDRIEAARQAAMKREREIQQRIAEIRLQSKIQLAVSPSLTTPTTKATVSNKDEQSRRDNFARQLNQTEVEFKALVDAGLLDSAQVDIAFERAHQILNNGDLAGAQAIVQKLDAARIQAMRTRDQLLEEQLGFARERVAAIRAYLPDEILTQLDAQMSEWASRRTLLTAEQVEQLHAAISFGEQLVQEAAEAAKAMASSWKSAGYHAQVLKGADQGDRLIEVRVHAEATTLIRIRFGAERLDLEAPPEAEEACSARLGEVLEAFRNQGYGLELTHIDGQPVNESFFQTERQQSSQPHRVDA